MSLATAAGRRALGKAYGLFAGALAFLVVVVAVAAQLGLDEAVIAFLVIAFTLVTYAVIGVVTRTLSLTDFYVAGRGVSEGFNGMATAAAFLSGGGLAAIAGAYFADATAALAVTVGWTVGFVLLAVLIAPYYRKSGAVTLPDFLAVRYGNPLIRPVAVVVLLVATFALLPAAIAVGATIIGVFLHVRPEVALAVVFVTLLFSSLFGGMRSVTFVSGAQVILILLGALVPVALLSAQDFGLPLPQITYGFALDGIAGGDDEPIRFLAGRWSPLGDPSGINLLALAVSLGAGVASLPHLLARSGTATGMASARRSVAWALVIVVAVMITAPAIAAFAKGAILETVVGVGLDELPAWLFAYGRLGLIETCGVAAASAADIGTACGAATVINGLAAGGVAVGGEALALAFADMVDLPYVMSALTAAGVLAAALATAGAVLMAVTATLAHDLYARMIDRRASAGRRLIVARLVLIAVAAVAARLAATGPGDMLAFAVYAPSLAASGFFPAIVLGLWWPRTTWPGALAGMVAGFAAALGYIFFAEIDAGAAPGLSAVGISGAASAFFGVPIGFAVAALVSLVGPRPSESRLEVLAAIRRPSHDPILEHHAV